MKILSGIALTGFIACLIGTLGCTNPDAADIRCGTGDAKEGGGGGCDSPYEAPPPIEIDRWRGDQQTGVVCTALTDSIVVHVVAATNNEPDGGASISWSTTDKGGRLSPTVSVTDSLGFARTRWTLGCVAGEQSASASTSAATNPTTFTATAVASPDTARR